MKAKFKEGERVEVIAGNYRGTPGVVKGPARGKHRGMLRVRLHGSWASCAQTIICLSAKSIRKSVLPQ